jgi:HSP20 family protein
VTQWPRKSRDQAKVERSHRAIQIRFGTLRSEMDRLFDNFLGGGLPTFPSLFTGGLGRGSMLVPNMDVKETDKEIVIEAELPGMEEKDVSLTLQEGVLTVQGEKKIEYDEDKENYHMMERRYGSFQRSLRLPDTVDEDKVEARFENGVLRITLPKRPEAGGAQRKIEIKTGKA